MSILTLSAQARSRSRYTSSRKVRNQQTGWTDPSQHTAVREFHGGRLRVAADNYL